MVILFILFQLMQKAILSTQMVHLLMNMMVEEMLEIRFTLRSVTCLRLGLPAVLLILYCYFLVQIMHVLRVLQTISLSMREGLWLQMLQIWDITNTCMIRITKVEAVVENILECYLMMWMRREIH